MPSKFSEKASTKCLFVASGKYYVSVYIVGFKLVFTCQDANICSKKVMKGQDTTGLTYR